MRRRLTERPTFYNDARKMIGVEFTDVVCKYSETLSFIIKEKYNLTFDKQEIQSEHFHKLLIGDDEDIKRIKWFKLIKKSPEFILGLEPSDHFFEFWNGTCSSSYAKRILVPDYLDETTIQLWMNKYNMSAGLNIIKQVDGWQRQTRAQWIIASNRKWLASVEEQAIAFQSPDAAGVYARSFFDVETIICQNDIYE